MIGFIRETRAMEAHTRAGNYQEVAFFVSDIFNPIPAKLVAKEPIRPWGSSRLLCCTPTRAPGREH